MNGILQHYCSTIFTVVVIPDALHTITFWYLVY